MQIAVERDELQRMLVDEDDELGEMVIRLGNRFIDALHQRRVQTRQADRMRYSLPRDGRVRMDRLEDLEPWVKRGVRRGYWPPRGCWLLNVSRTMNQAPSILR